MDAKQLLHKVHDRWRQCVAKPETTDLITPMISESQDYNYYIII